MDRLRLIALAVASLVFVQSALRAAEEGPARPNIVFILADDLGYTDLACYGSGYYETPHVDRLAAEGVRLTSGYTCGPNCQPTRAALLSGQYGPRTAVYTVGGIDRFDWRSRPLRPVDNVSKLPLDKITIAQTLKNAGYATGMFGKWHLGNDGDHHPSKRGFDEALVSEGKHFDFKTNPPVDVPDGAYLADFLTEKAEDFIRRHREEPFFLYLPHFGVHSPYQAKPELIERFKDKPAAGGHDDPTYAAMIASVDESVGRIVALLDELSLSQNTVVIFTSDNGGVGGYEREGIIGGSVTDNAPLKGGKGMLYEGGIRVPFIVRWPGKIAPAVSDAPINSVDFYPTLLEIAGVELPESYVLDGESWLPQVVSPNEAQPREAPLFWHFPGYLGAGKGTWRTTPAGAIRDGDWKLIEFFEDGRLELYDLRNDIGERHNLAEKEPAKAAELQGKLAAWRSEVGAKLPMPNDPQKAGPKKPKRGKKAATGTD
ncbi:MAG TPA: sulfatase [Pirellulaceae bacterium]|nr:sulfatase [Pirellulaceae bacterium]